jgi:hypothetical protein
MSNGFYSDYEISDRAIALHGGKRKGVKLGLGGIVPIEVFAQAWNSDGVDRTEGLGRRRESLSLRIFKDSLGRWNALLNAVAPEKETQQQRMEALLEWAEQRLVQKEEESVERVVERAAPDGELMQGAIAPVNPLPDVPDQLQSIIGLIVQQQLQQALANVMPLNQVQGDRKNGEKMLSIAQQPKARGRGTSSEATNKVDRTINAIMKHNDTPGRRHDEKWEITLRSVIALGCSQSVVYRVFESRANDIQMHHDKHLILSGHNARHRGKNTINQVIQL